MKELKHTPGPWKAERELIKAPMGRMNFAEFTTKEGYQPILDRSERWLTMGIQPWVQFPPLEWTEMQEANAKLIAAAPELLEALILIEKRTTDLMYRLIDSPGEVDNDITIKKVREAIKKATE